MCRNCCNGSVLQSSVHVSSSASSCPSSPHHTYSSDQLTREGSTTLPHTASEDDVTCLERGIPNCVDHLCARERRVTRKVLPLIGPQLRLENRTGTLEHKQFNNFVTYSGELPLHCKLLSAHSLPDVHQARRFFNFSEDTLKEYSERRLLGYVGHLIR